MWPVSRLRSGPPSVYSPIQRGGYARIAEWRRRSLPWSAAPRSARRSPLRWRRSAPGRARSSRSRASPVSASPGCSPIWRPAFGRGGRRRRSLRGRAGRRGGGALRGGGAGGARRVAGVRPGTAGRRAAIVRLPPPGGAPRGVRGGAERVASGRARPCRRGARAERRRAGRARPPRRAGRPSGGRGGH